jgi:hypothetical protein
VLGDSAIQLQQEDQRWTLDILHHEIEHVVVLAGVIMWTICG